MWLNGLLAVLLFAGSARAANYTDLLPGTKAAGMGMAFVSIADDPYALFYNPAGLANSPYTQTSATAGRMLSPVGKLAFSALAYTRPFDLVKSATLGGAYLAQRQIDSGDKDIVLFHYSQEFKVPELFLTKPLKVGGNFKVINAEQGAGAGFGFGFDVGVLARSAMGLSGGFTLSDLSSNVGLPRPMIGMGVSYLWRRWLTVAGDFRIRSNLTEFYPGIEASFFQGLLKVRGGRALKLDYVESVALGLGINFSPVIIDIAMSLPWSGVQRDSGGYQFSFTYKFGAPPFAGNFVGMAATQAEKLKEDILRLEDKKTALKAQAGAAETNRESGQGEVRALEERIKALQDDYGKLLRRKEETAYELSSDEFELKRKMAPKTPPKPAPKPAPKPVIRWPRQHTVEGGDTLRSIANQYYNDPNLWERIYDANKDKIDRGMPQEGSVLTIPQPPSKP